MRLNFKMIETTVCFKQSAVKICRPNLRNPPVVVVVVFISEVSFLRIFLQLRKRMKSRIIYDYENHIIIGNRNQCGFEAKFNIQCCIDFLLQTEQLNVYHVNVGCFMPL